MSDEVAVHHRVPPYVLVSGPESLLAERGVAQVLDDLKVSEPELETIRLYAAAYTAGEQPRDAQQRHRAGTHERLVPLSRLRPPHDHLRTLTRRRGAARVEPI